MDEDFGDRLKNCFLNMPKVFWIFTTLFSMYGKEYANGWTAVKKTRIWFAKARHEIRRGKVKKVISELKGAISSQQNLPDTTLNVLKNLVLYLETHVDHMNYDKFKELGFPIGSGMVESTCKWLIQQRFKGVGMRWSESGFNHLLHLRLVWVNDEFDELFDFSPN